MIRVQFNGQNNMLQVDFKTISPEVVQLTGDNIPKCTAGFKAYRRNGDFLGDYSDYTNIVAETKNGLQFAKPKRAD